MGSSVIITRKLSKLLSLTAAREVILALLRNGDNHQELMMLLDAVYKGYPKDYGVRLRRQPWSH